MIRGQDYKEIWSMDWCSTNDSVLNKQKVVTIKKSESDFFAQFEFRTQTKVNKSQTQ